MSSNTQVSTEVDMPARLNTMIAIAFILVILLVVGLAMLAIIAGSKHALQALLALATTPFIVKWARRGGVFGK